MLTPPTPHARSRTRLLVGLVFVSGALVGVAGSLAGVLLARTSVVVECPAGAPATVTVPPSVQIVDVAPSLTRSSVSPSLAARFSAQTQMIDRLSPGAYTADGTPDEIIELELEAHTTVRHIFVNGNGGSHQWDTVIGDDPIPFGAVFEGQPGAVTWHLGVRENQSWRTDPQTGALSFMPIGRHRLELVGNGVDPGPRAVTVLFVDGTLLTTQVTGRYNDVARYPSQLGGVEVDGNR